MSIESARAFLEEAQRNAVVRGRLDALERSDERDLLGAVVRAGAEAGFTFTAEEYETVIAELAESMAAPEHGALADPSPPARKG